MWWKKLLYYLLVVVLGIGITTLSASICFNNLSKDVVKTAVKNEQYTYAESFFNYVSVNDQDKFYAKKSNNSQIEIYPCLIKQPYFRYDESKKIYIQTYDIVEEAIGITIFNLPESFSLEDTKETKGLAKLILDNETSIDLFYDNSKSEDSTTTNHRINFYSYVNEYDSLTVYITFSDFVKQSGNEDRNIRKIEIYDGKSQIFYSIDDLQNVGFHNSLNSDYHESCMAYREYMLLYGEGKSVTTFERKDALLKKIEEITNTHRDKYIPKPDRTVVMKENAFILTIALTLSIYISVAIFVSGLIWHRKK